MVSKNAMPGKFTRLQFYNQRKSGSEGEELLRLS